MLATQIGVGGTTAFVEIMKDETLTNDEKRGLLQVLFNLTDEQIDLILGKEQQ